MVLHIRGRVGSRRFFQQREFLEQSLEKLSLFMSIVSLPLLFCQATIAFCCDICYALR